MKYSQDIVALLAFNVCNLPSSNDPIRIIEGFDVLTNIQNVVNQP